MNRLLQEILRAYVSQRHDDWDKRLAAAEFAINNSPSASSGQSPFYLNYGFHPLTPATLGLRKLSRANNQAAQDFWDRMQTDLSAAKDLLEQAQERQARYANTKRADAEFAVGDQVLLSTANLRLRTDGPAGKFNPRWCGPFEILERIGKVAYKLELPSTMRVHPVFHVSLLKTYHSSDDSDRPQPPRPPPIQDEDVFLADTLLDRRTVKQGKRTVVEYLVKWEGYPLYEATWEPASHLLGTDLKKMRQEMDKRYQQAARDLAATQRQQPLHRQQRRHSRQLPRHLCGVPLGNGRPLRPSLREFSVTVAMITHEQGFGRVHRKKDNASQVKATAAREFAVACKPGAKPPNPPRILQAAMASKQQDRQLMPAPPPGQPQQQQREEGEL